MTRLDLEDIPPPLLLRINSPEYWEWLQVLRDNWIDSDRECEAGALTRIIEKPFFIYASWAGPNRNDGWYWWVDLHPKRYEPGRGGNSHKTWPDAMRWLIRLVLREVK